MIERYRKFGRVVRRENDVLVRADEAGEAIERNESFECAPIDAARDLPEVDVGAVESAANELAKLRPERLIVSEGVAFHECDGREWSERTRRIHLSIARPPYRVLIDAADFDLGGIEAIADALSRATETRRVDRVRLAPRVGAALLPSLIGTISMQQWPAAHDGKGNWIDSVGVTDGPAPNWFRPSYRSRPVRAWFHLRVDAFGEIDRDLPEAIALLAPIHGRTLHVLCVERGTSFISTVGVERVTAAQPAETWFPFAAGCYGVEFIVHPSSFIV